MLHLVEVSNDRGDILSLPLGQPSGGIILTAIDGLDPVKAAIVSSDYAQQDGEEFHNARRGSRNILIGLALDSRFGGGTTRELRQLLYGLVMPKQKVTLSFHLENGLVLKIDGVVESLQSPMFSEKPVAVLSIICHDPDFYDPTLLADSGEAYNTIHEYPVFYEGSVPTGINLELDINSSVAASGFTVYHRNPNNEVNTLSFNASLQNFDVIKINTTPGEKNATLTRAGNISSIIAGINPRSVWPMLEPGLNHIAVLVSGSQMYYEYSYIRRYGGL